eukprot:2441027-Prymnesium_polylepis.1
MGSRPPHLKTVLGGTRRKQLRDLHHSFSADEGRACCGRCSRADEGRACFLNTDAGGACSARRRKGGEAEHGGGAGNAAGHQSVAHGRATSAIADAFVEAYKAANPDDTVAVLDISGENLPAFTAARAQAKFKVWGGGAAAADDDTEWVKTKELIAEFTSATKYVVCAPMHNFQIPAALKLYIDHLLQPHLTFRPADFTGL